MPRNDAGFKVSETQPVPGRLLRRLWIALAVTALFMVISTIQSVVRAGYDPWHQAVSALSLGPTGWIQTVNFVVFGAVITWTAPTWHRILAGGVGAQSYPLLITVLGASFVAAGLIPQDPAPGYDPAGLALTAATARGIVHLAIAGVAAGCSVASLVVMARRFSGDRSWPGWATYSRVMAALLIVCVVVYGVWSKQASGFAGTFERAAILIPLIWTFTFLRRLDAGTPFMVAR